MLDDAQRQRPSRHDVLTLLHTRRADRQLAAEQVERHAREHRRFVGGNLVEKALGRSRAGRNFFYHRKSGVAGNRNAAFFVSIATPGRARSAG
jgi:hypothetical protein